MIEVSAATLEEAYIKASEELSCSITELTIDIVQNPSKGFLGFGKKEAIITVEKKSAEGKKSRPVKAKKHQVIETDESSRIVEEIKERVNRLFGKSCFNMDEIQVEMRDNNEVAFHFNGEDSALMIGKEGYRYKAISYFLYNWVNMKYGLNMRLEIAEFLKNQEDNTVNYLEDVKNRVHQNGRAQTKILDGVLIKIALVELRTTFPNKYVAIKSNREGGKFIVINDFLDKK
jgi:spoIIIJ-associated protein